MDHESIERIRSLATQMPGHKESLLAIRHCLSLKYGVVLPPCLDIERPRSNDLYDSVFLSEDEMRMIIGKMRIDIEVWPGQAEAFQAALDRLEAEIGVNLSSRGFRWASDGLCLKYEVRDLPPSKSRDEDGKLKFGPGVPAKQFFANRQRQRRWPSIHRFYQRLVALARSLFS